MVLAAVLSPRGQVRVDPLGLTVLYEQVGPLLVAVPVDRSTDDRIRVGHVLDDLQIIRTFQDQLQTL